MSIIIIAALMLLAPFGVYAILCAIYGEDEFGPTTTNARTTTGTISTASLSPGYTAAMAEFDRKVRAQVDAREEDHAWNARVKRAMRKPVRTGWVIDHDPANNTLMVWREGVGWMGAIVTTGLIESDLDWHGEGVRVMTPEECPIGWVDVNSLRPSTRDHAFTGRPQPLAALSQYHAGQAWRRDGHGVTTVQDEEPRYNDHYGRLLLALDPGDEPEDQQPLWENRRVAIHTGICNCTGCSNRKLVNVRARKPRAKK